MKNRSASLLLAAAGMLTTGTVFAENAGWNYEGKTGPAHWGSLSADFALCEKGMMQSPIDLAAHNAVGDVEVAVDYQAGPLKVVRDVHEVKVEFAPGSSMTSGGTVFNLIQVHFHTPSEHTFDGKTYPLVAHFVHATDAGELGVLGVLFEEGDANAELQQVIAAAQAAPAGKATDSGKRIDPNRLLPGQIEVYRYMGSLTTPPCSEGVNWHVAEAPLTASAAQLAAMTEMLGMNARPVLPLNNRLLVKPE